MKALIDADILVYRVGHVCNEEDVKVALAKTDAFLDNLFTLDLPDIFEYQLFLTGKDNFRFDKAVTAPYKGNRKEDSKPVHYEAIRKHMVKKWKAKVIDGREADDELAIEQYKGYLKHGNLDHTVIVTLDKDLDQVAGWHYNFVKQDFYFIQPKQGDTLLFKQFLTGDRVDNIIGVKGIGAVKAGKLLDGVSNRGAWNIIVEKLGLERAIENGHLLYMLRHEADSFENWLETQELMDWKEPEDVPFEPRKPPNIEDGAL